MTDQPATLSIEAAQDEEADTKRFAAQLQKDARSWSTREDSGERAAEATLAVAAKQPAPQCRASAVLPLRRPPPRPPPTPRASPSPCPMRVRHVAISRQPARPRRTLELDAISL